MALPSISGYTVNERLGTGGFASVYLATPDKSTAVYLANKDDELAEDDDRVAIKVLHHNSSDENDLRRFERERNTMRAFNGHPHIVQVFESGQTEDGSHYTVLEYISGGSVRDLLVEQRALHWSEVTRIAVQICSALNVAHRSGVLHRDVKPANVLLSDGQAKLTDFGIARLVGQSQVTAAQSIIGTLAYTPPEVFHGDPFDGRGDIYQLGITMYEMLLGRAPFSSAVADNKATIIRRILDQPAPALAPFDIPQEISDLLEDVLAKDPADRPQSAESFGKRINEIEAELGRTPTPLHLEQVPEDDIDPGNAPTIAIDMDPNPTVDSIISGEQTQLSSRAPGLEESSSTGDSSDSVWPAAATAAGTPTPPEVAPPDDVNATVQGPRPGAETSLLAADPPKAASNPPASEGASAGTTKVAPASPSSGGTSKKRMLWPLLLFGLIVVGGAGALYALNGLDGDNGTNGGGDSTIDESPDVEQPTDDTTPEPDTADDDREFAAIDDPVFAEPSGSDGVIFGSVATSQGLTMVGSAGDGESVGDQRSIVWTFGNDEFGLVDLEETGPHRMWSIGVLEGETFLAVGDTQGPDGIAWTGSIASNFSEVPNVEFSGAANDRLRTSVADPSQPLSFLVGGSRTVDNLAVAGLWEVSGETSWDDPEWTTVDLNAGNPGVINDIAVNDEFAVAVGTETVNGQDMAMILIRRGEDWSDLLGALPNTELWSVTIAGERIIAVGNTGSNTANPTPIAIVADSSGSVPLSHSLPIRSGEGGVETGIARSVITLADGGVVAVGDVGRSLDPSNPDAEIDRDGAIWQLLPGDEMAADVWTTRASPDLLADGFVELWTVNEHDGSIYVFGRTETNDGRRPAGGWTLDLD